MTYLIHVNSRGGLQEWVRCTSPDEAFRLFKDYWLRHWVVAAMLITSDGKLGGVAVAMNAARTALMWDVNIPTA